LEFPRPDKAAHGVVIALDPNHASKNIELNFGTWNWRIRAVAFLHIDLGGFKWRF
jgi:hypothetical protein